MGDSETSRLQRDLLRIAPVAHSNLREAVRDWRRVCAWTSVPERYGRRLHEAGGWKRVLSFCMGGSSRFREDRDMWIEWVTSSSFGTTPIYLDGFAFRRSMNSKKKYDVYKDGVKLCSFGATGYEQFRDKIGIYAADDHMDPSRRTNYFARHGRFAKKLSPRWFSHRYLW